MTKFAIIALAAFMAAGAAQAQIKITGKNEQKVKVQGAVINAAIGMGATAKQNLSSNAGKVEIGGDNKQTTEIQGAVINAAIGMKTTAKQNLASNTSDK
ncbi:hypothetical protein [Variovorax sp. PCZ-1]|uniref:hypothetical protein n=1 Tax=Variovorax sp. PCZ-1 TaxID=2835533 RepID=UPI001BD0B387|nr:hypothetical protein [Variovorax sp. PCZ-1]MBS7807645.1 hypothetical protein [Variovorax sp. PCZ-1]